MSPFQVEMGRLEALAALSLYSSTDIRQAIYSSLFCFPKVALFFINPLKYTKTLL